MPPETLAFRDALQQTYGFTLHEFSPTTEQIADVEYLRLWDGDMELYSKLTKLDPLPKAIKELRATALLTGVRRDQTPNRATLGYLGRGGAGEVRVHPLIDWDKQQIDAYIDTHALPRNLLYTQGYGSVGDVHATKPGADRAGRTVIECGIHVPGGKVITQ